MSCISIAYLFLLIFFSLRILSHFGSRLLMINPSLIEVRSPARCPLRHCADAWCSPQHPLRRFVGWMMRHAATQCIDSPFSVKKKSAFFYPTSLDILQQLRAGVRTYLAPTVDLRSLSLIYRYIIYINTL